MRLEIVPEVTSFAPWTTGLRIAPPEAPVTGYMFGKGVYFADMFSKSANYCCASSQLRDGVLLLCEVYVIHWNNCFLVILFFLRRITDNLRYVFSQVALGEMAELLAADYNADRLPKGKLRFTTLLLFARLWLASSDILIIETWSTTKEVQKIQSLLSHSPLLRSDSSNWSNTPFLSFDCLFMEYSAVCPFHFSDINLFDI